MRKRSAPLHSGNLSPLETGKPEISLELLQNLAFELLSKSVTLWRTYQDTEKSKGIKIHTGLQILDRLYGVMRLHPDMQHLTELDEWREEAERLVAAARKIHPLSEPAKGDSLPTPTQNDA